MRSSDTLDSLKGLPPELAELDAELSELQLEERPSFGPELRNELAREWPRPRPRRRTVWMRHALAASVAAVAFAGLAVPPARASLVEGVQRFITTLQGDEELVTEETLTLEQVLFEESTPETEAAVELVDAAEAVESAEAELIREANRLPPFRPGTSSIPRLVDPDEGRELIRGHYPESLQRAGVGGTVTLQLWVEEDGSVDHVQVARGSGVLELDRAALLAGPGLRFQPAQRNGVPVATWVEFDLVFEPLRTTRPAEPEILETPQVPERDGWVPPRSWTEAAVIPSPILMESREMLRVAMGDEVEALEARFGSLENVLSGEVPRGRNPQDWHRDVTRALEEARIRDPENPAPYLALARIRRKQGLRNDAQMLFGEGLKRARRGDRPVSPRLVAELSYETGRLARENWLAWRDLGELPGAALDPARCPGRTGSPSEVASPETLLGWNYACAGVLGEILDASFRPRSESEPLRQTMLAAFVGAVDAYPAHVGANTEILLELADQEAWHPLLEGARRFGWASQGHPNALLLEGLALHRLGRVEEAAERFGQAMDALPEEVRQGFQGLSLLQPELSGSQEAAVWRTLDPILSTTVNERRVEHWARAAYAELRFGSLAADASRVWLRYGRPNQLRTFGAGAGLRLEFWDYGEGPDVTFYRPAASQNGALTTEGEEYLEDLAGAFPHWYGTRARPLYGLPAQIAQFRGSRDGTSEVKVRFDVPGEFRSRSGPPLNVGVFLVGAGGVPMETLRWSVERDQRVVELVAPAGPGVVQVVVELMDTESQMTAGARVPVNRGVEEVSEILLTAPVEVDRNEVGRMGDGLDVRSSADRLVGDEMGVFVELYGLAREDTYRIRAELVSAGSGRAFPVEIRPSGQTLFGGEWARRPLEPGIACEFLTLDLRGVGPGEYHLRLTTELADGTTRVRELRGLTRVAEDPAPVPLSAPMEML